MSVRGRELEELSGEIVKATDARLEIAWDSCLELWGGPVKYGSACEHDVHTPILKTGDKYTAVSLKIMRGIFVSIFVRAYLYEGYICMMNADANMMTLANMIASHHLPPTYLKSYPSPMYTYSCDPAYLLCYMHIPSL